MKVSSAQDGIPDYLDDKDDSSGDDDDTDRDGTADDVDHDDDDDGVAGELIDG